VWSYVILLLMLGANFLLSMSELAIVSCRRIRLEQRAEKGDRGAAVALELFDAPTRFLSVAQAGITAVAIFSGAFGEKSIASQLEHWLMTFPRIAPYADGTAFVVVVLGIGYFTLVFGELVPKRLGMNNPEPIACAVSRPMMWLSVATGPVVTLLSGSTDFVLGLLGAKNPKSEAVTAEEIKGLVEQGKEEGTILEAEQRLVERALRLGDMTVTALMVPRTEITWLKADEQQPEVARVIRETNRSHYPLYEGDLEHPVGVVHVKDIAQAAIGGPVELRKIMRPPVFIPESTPMLRVLDEFTKRGVHIAFVLDEYGGLSGMITYNDIVAGVMGRADRRESVEEEPREIRRADGSLLLDGLLPISRLREIIGVKELPREEAGFKTLAGLLMTNLGRVPKSGDLWEWEGHRFEVMDMDGRRVDKVLYAFAAPAPEGEAASPD